jgi:hypothetical protein
MLPISPIAGLPGNCGAAIDRYTLLSYFYSF